MLQRLVRAWEDLGAGVLPPADGKSYSVRVRRQPLARSPAPTSPSAWPPAAAPWRKAGAVANGMIVDHRPDRLVKEEHR
jgi:hypothetical protein